MQTQDTNLPMPDTLLKQIDDLCALVKDIQGETVEILQQDNVLDASAHLQDVLTSTEAATHTIIDSVTAIQGISDCGGGADADKQQIGEHVTHVYEACNFQDVTGQRIKKVLRGLGTLQDSILRLAQTAKGATDDDPPLRPLGETLLNGPQLIQEAPRQEDIDAMFSSFAAES